MDICIADNIRFVGVDDTDIDLFEAQYPVPKGISYNSYLIEDEHIAVVDSVDIRKVDAWLLNISRALDGRQPDYLIVQHMEPDHSGSVARFLQAYPHASVVCTAKAASMLPNFFPEMQSAPHMTTVAEGDILSLGHHSLKFLMAPMVHWPEVMMTFCPEAGVIFSADAFGTFATSNGGHPITAPSEEHGWDAEARRYYTNIVGKFGRSVQMVLRKLSTLPIKVIAPLHGPVIAGDLPHFIDLYDKWSSHKPEAEKGVLVAYASVYGGTARAANILADSLRSRGVADVVVMDLNRTHVSEALSQAFRLGTVALCSVTYDGSIFPAMHAFIHHMVEKGLSGRRFALVENGSWAPTAARHMEAMVSPLPGAELILPAVTIHSRPDHKAVSDLEALAAKIANN